MRRLLARALLLLTVAFEASAAPVGQVRGAIIGGTVSVDDPSVVGLLAGERLFCSGVLIAPRVVLTAAHCVALIRDLSVFHGSAPGLDGEIVPVMDVRVHSRYVPAELENDIALLRLARDVSPDSRPRVAPLDPSVVGRQVRIVGFGKSAHEDESPPVKRTGTAVLSELHETRLSLSAGPSIPCFRDSGGAIFLSGGGEESLAGIILSGSVTCEPSLPSRGMRADVFLEEFISPYLDEGEPAEGCAASSGPVSWALLALAGLVSSLRKRRFARTGSGSSCSIPRPMA